MPFFSVVIEGRDFPARLSDDGSTCLGFFTTRHVEAGEAKAAELMAVELIRTELRDIVGARQDGDSTPMMFLDELWSIEDIPATGSGGGFTWFPMDAEE